MTIKGSPLIHTLLGGALSAFLFLSVTFAPNFGMALLSSLAPIPLFMVGLALGRRPVIVASLITCALIFLIAHPIHGLSYTILYALPIIVLSDRALLNRKVGKDVHWYPARRLAFWLTGMAAAIVFFAVLMIAPYSDPNQMMESIQQLGPILGPQPDEALEALSKVLPYFPAFFGFSWCFSMIINAALAQGILVGFKANLRPSPSLTSIQFPRWLLAVAAAGPALAFIDMGTVTQLARNLCPIILIPFILAGIGYVHTRINQLPSPPFFFILFYLALFLFPWTLLFLALGGIILTATQYLLSNQSKN